MHHVTSWLYKAYGRSPARIAASNPAQGTRMLVLLCVVRIRCFPGKSDHYVATHICGYSVGKFADITHTDPIVSQINSAQDTSCVVCVVQPHVVWFHPGIGK